MSGVELRTRVLDILKDPSFLTRDIFNILYEGKCSNELKERMLKMFDIFSVVDPETFSVVVFSAFAMIASGIVKQSFLEIKRGFARKEKVGKHFA